MPLKSEFKWDGHIWSVSCGLLENERGEAIVLQRPDSYFDSIHLWIYLEDPVGMITPLGWQQKIQKYNGLTLIPATTGGPSIFPTSLSYAAFFIPEDNAHCLGVSMGKDNSNHLKFMLIGTGDKSNIFYFRSLAKELIQSILDLEFIILLGELATDSEILETTAGARVKEIFFNYVEITYPEEFKKIAK